MSRVALRVLIRNIDDLIAQESYQKAFLQARHVLYHFPKYLDAYRVMGKAFLEARQYSNALDIFLRLLSAVPDDFLAHVALSIIREEEGDLEAAIWHMERAFEVQPSNLLVQEELQRLYREREGVAPPRIHPTRATLARIYVRAGLYPQAIVELEALLKEHPKRYDLMGLLSEVYERVGQDKKAMEMAARLLRVLPYHWTANWVMARLLRQQGKEDEAQRYWDRIIEMDPYAAHISDEWPTPDQVPDDVVTLPEPEEMEEWEEELPVLGEGLEDIFVLEAESSLLSALPGETSSPEAKEEVERSREEEPTLPAWFQQAEKEPPVPEEKGPEPPSEAEEAVPELEPGELPEWLRALAEETPGEEASDQEVPAWLDEILGTGEAEPETALPEAQAAPPAEPSEEAVTPASGEEPSEAFPVAPLEEKTAAEEVLEPSLWTSEATEETLPDFLVQETDRAQEPPMEEAPPVGEVTTEEKEGILLAEDREALQPEPEAAPPEFLEDAEATLAWLEALAAKHGVPEEELITRPEERPPVEAGEPRGPEGEILENAPEEAPVAEEPVSSEVEGPEPSAIPLAQEALEERLDALAFEEGQPTPEDETPFGSVERKGWPEFEEPTSIPEPEPLQPEPPTPQAEAEPAFESPETLASETTPWALAQEEGFPSLEDEDATLAWLETLAAKHGVPEEELITRPEERPKVPETPPPAPIAEDVPSEEPVQEEPEILEGMPVSVPSKEPEAEIRPAEPSVVAAEVAEETTEMEAPVEEAVPAQAELPEEPASPEEEEEIPAWLRLVEEEEGEVVTETEIPEWEYVEDLETSTAGTSTPEAAPAEPSTMPVAEVATEEPEKQTAPPIAPASETPRTEPRSQEQVPDEKTSVEETAPLDPQMVESWLKTLEQEREKEAAQETPGAVAEPIPGAPIEPTAPRISAPEPTDLPDTPEGQMLREAREALHQNDLERALSLYRKIMRKKRYLDMVIEDLYKAQYEHPLSVELLMLLSDACSRAGRLKEAMDVLWKAEQLVR